MGLNNFCASLTIFKIYTPSPKSLTLAPDIPHPRCHVTHATRASTSSTLARHPHQPH